MRRALCVGIDLYSFGSLRGCVSDAKRLADLLGRNEDRSPNFDVKLLLAPLAGGQDSVTRRGLRDAIEDLLAQPADVALLTFSGHGSQNSLGGYLVTQDATRYDEGVSMSDVIGLANISKATEVVILLDCCHSGHLGSITGFDNSKALLREGVSVLTASRGDQVSVEDTGGGVFTSLVADALEGGGADLLGHVTVPSIYALVEAALGAWDQRPLFKSHVARVVPLRTCRPAVPIEVLRALPTLFPLPAEDHALTPEFEPSHAQHDPAKGQVFRQLQALSRVHLVVPVDAGHMYDAAIRSTACRLTPSGRYYWRLAAKARL